MKFLLCPQRTEIPVPDRPERRGKTVEEASNVGCPSLYGSIPSATESGAEAEDESGPNTPFQQSLIASTSKETEKQLPELSGGDIVIF